MSDVTVIVVNYNSGSLSRGAVRSAAADLGAADWNAIVVDNASPDGSAAALDGLERTMVIRNTENIGFGAAVNQAATHTDAPLLWLLNPDCVVVGGAFGALRTTLEADKECAIAAPRLVNADGSVQASARGNPSAWTGLFGRHAILSRLFPSSSMAKRNLPARDLVESGLQSAVVDWVMGASMLIRRGPFDAVGGFDERYFLYWEDADLCRRLRNAGWTTRYVPGAIVEHPGGASAATARAFSSRVFHESAYRYYATHVAPSPWHPARWFARVALPLRGWWRGR